MQHLTLDKYALSGAWYTACSECRCVTPLTHIVDLLCPSCREG